MQQRRHFPKRLKRNDTCEGNAIERSSKLFHESSEIRNKRQVRFQAILCPNLKWRPCFYIKQLSVPIDGSANFKFLALSRCNKYRYWSYQFEWRNNRSCLRNNCNNNCDNDSSLDPRNKNCNNERAKISAREMQSNSSSSKLFHELSEIRNKRQVRFRAILCPNPKWWPCFHAAFCPKWHPCNHNFKFQAA